jgi:hypothetical protein
MLIRFVLPVQSILFRFLRILSRNIFGTAFGTDLTCREARSCNVLMSIDFSFLSHISDML